MGWRVDAGEPIVWIDQIMRDGLSPAPQHVPRVLGNDPNGAILAVRVWPVPDPPCITIDGQVFERVPGRTVPVATSADLARLFDRGERARERAEKAALDGLVRARWKPPESAQPALYTVSLAATGLPDDVRASIYRESFVHSLREVLLEASPTPHRYVAPHSTFQDQAVVAWLFDFNQVEGAFLIVHENAAVTFGFTDPEHNDGQYLLTAGGHLKQAWSTCLRVATSIGCYGSAIVAVSSSGRRGELASRAWTEMGKAIDQDHLDFMLRDLRRSQGDAAWEPEFEGNV